MEKSRVGPFLLSNRLGEDSAGSVYHAIHSEQRKPVALKLFAAPFATGSEVGTAFAHEWDALKKLRHPNIVRCYGGGFEEMQAYLAYELVQGETLAALLARRGHLTWDMAVEYGLQIAAGLEFAHGQGIAHQALSPDKLLISELGVVQIADFRVDRQNQSMYQATSKRTARSVAYAAPEQLKPTPISTPKSDLYSLGCILFEMVVGHVPFTGGTLEEVIENKLAGSAPRVATLALDCPVWLDVLIGQLLAADPTKRPYSATAVRLALEETKRRVAAGTSVAEHAVSGLSPLKMQADKTEARKVLGRKARKPQAEILPLLERPWFIASGLAVLMAVVISLGAFLFWPLSEQQLIDRADALMASEDKGDWQTARESYLDPLLRRFPDSDYAPRAKAHIDQIEMEQAENRLRIKIKLGREPKNEGERLYAEAVGYEQFGDRITALDKYQSLVNLFEEEGPERPYVQLAKRQIAKLNQGDDKDDGRADFVKSRLAKADELAAKGEAVEARKIWHSIVSLYGNNREVRPLVEQAQDKLAGKGAAAAGAIQPPEE